MINIKIRTKPGASVPEYRTPGSAGADIKAFLNKAVILNPGERTLVPTGLFLEIPEGYEAQIRPRSGLAIEHGIILPNSPGTIDSDYRGEIKVILLNAGQKPFSIEPEMRIAQLVLARVFRGDFVPAEELNATIRNEGGFGHTGI